ncbi:MAG: hypothetical protein ACRD9Q_06675 [Nitrososphaeraceae archaeon]
MIYKIFLVGDGAKRKPKPLVTIKREAWERPQVGQELTYKRRTYRVVSQKETIEPPVIINPERVYVADRGLLKVKIFELDGTFVSDFQAYTPGIGELEYIGTDNKGNIYCPYSRTSDQDPQKIKRFDKAGENPILYASTGYSSINDVATDSRRHSFTSSGSIEGLIEHDENGILIGLRPIGSIAIYKGIAIDSNDNFFTTSGDPYIRKIDKNFNVVTTWTQGTSTRIAVDKSNNVYVYDHDSKRLNKYDNNGNFLSFFSITDGIPVGLAVSSENLIYVTLFTGSFHNTVRVFNQNGVFQFTFGIDGVGTGNSFAFISDIEIRQPTIPPDTFDKNLTFFVEPLNPNKPFRRNQTFSTFNPEFPTRP